MGAIYDVIIELRPDSPTFKLWLAVELTVDNRCNLYGPGGFAHGFLTLARHTEVFYQMSECYALAYARGIRENDPTFGIQWPAEVRVISERDKQYPDFTCYQNPKCEPQLGKRESYRTTGGQKEGGINELALLWVLNLSDGSHTLLDIADSSDLEFGLIKNAADALLEHGLLKECPE